MGMFFLLKYPKMMKQVDNVAIPVWCLVAFCMQRVVAELKVATCLRDEVTIHYARGILYLVTWVK